MINNKVYRSNLIMFLFDDQINREDAFEDAFVN